MSPVSIHCQPFQQRHLLQGGPDLDGVWEARDVGRHSDTQRLEPRSVGSQGQLQGFHDGHHFYCPTNGK